MNKTHSKKKKVDFLFPLTILKPVGEFLKTELEKLKKQQKRLEEEDPMADGGNQADNSAAAVDNEVVEQVGRMGVEAKSKFIRGRLIQVRKALTRIKLGSYGICEKCGKMIDTDRLTIYPEATLCIGCEKEKEK